MVTTDEAMVWHNDGHAVVLRINKENLEVVSVICPHDGKEERPCGHSDTNCVVRWFLTTYGMECNVGVSKPTDILNVAWTFVGEVHRDLGSCQVWVIPTDDEAFSAWMVTQS